MEGWYQATSFQYKWLWDVSAALRLEFPEVCMFVQKYLGSRAADHGSWGGVFGLSHLLRVTVGYRKPGPNMSLQLPNKQLSPEDAHPK